MSTLSATMLARRIRESKGGNYGKLPEPKRVKSENKKRLHDR